jgi:PAS domain S-box-containing protein
MPDLDGFQLAGMIREHPRFQKTAIIFISAIHLTDVDHLRGYEIGGVDYVPVPVIPEVLRAKVKVFAELYRKTRQLEQLNAELEARVASRTAELEASTARLLESEQRRSLALAAGAMGSWDWDIVKGDCLWDEGQCGIFGVDPKSFAVTREAVGALLHAEDLARLQAALDSIAEHGPAFQAEFRVRRPNGELRWCIGSAAASFDGEGRIVRLSGVTIDITERKQAEERQALLAREVDHRARNALALVQSIVRLTRAEDVDSYVAAVEGRIKALARAHTVLSQTRWQGADLAGLVDEELAPYRNGDAEKIAAAGPDIVLQPATAQTLALALHELASNAAKYGALSAMTGRLRLGWQLSNNQLVLNWSETGGPVARTPVVQGFGTRIIVTSIERQLGGKVAFEWRPEGLHCTFSIPRSDKIEPVVACTVAGRSPERDGETRKIAGHRIMIVDDEALAAMIVGDILGELGFETVGPFSRLAEAVAAVGDAEIDGAILDINLGGELVYPLADLLTARGTPFVFVTGYGAESVEPRFENVPILQKPIERQMLQQLFEHRAPPQARSRRRDKPAARPTARAAI